MKQYRILECLDVSPAFVALLCAYFYFDPAQTFFVRSDAVKIQHCTACSQEGIFSLLGSATRVRRLAVKSHVKLPAAHKVSYSTGNGVRWQRHVFRRQRKMHRQEIIHTVKMAFVNN